MAQTGGTTPSASSVASTDTSFVPNQLAQLVPTFDPAKDDVLVYGQKVQLLLAAWPSGKYTELGTRLILGCSGSAFLKLQLHQSEVTGNDPKCIQRLVEILGGTWGQINLEKRYEYAERALYKCSQKADESADSYLARADIMWAELRARDIKLDDLEPYVTLRGSQLSSEDKKRVLMEVDAANSGKLTISKVAASIRMLGATFFHDMTGQRRVRGKTYDQSALLADHQEQDQDDSQPAMVMDYADEIPEDELMETLLEEGDYDATLVADFEGSATDVIQSDPELASALTAYTEARRRLSEKFRSRGFWPPSHGGKGKSKGGHRGPKGKFGKQNYQRKSLQQRIMESRCRICNQYGHWKAECPQKGNGSGAGDRPLQAPTSFVQTLPSNPALSGLPLEFFQLPENAPSIDEPRVESCLACNVDVNPKSSNWKREIHNIGSPPKHVKLFNSVCRWKKKYESRLPSSMLRSDKCLDQPVIPMKSEACRVDSSIAAKTELPSGIAETCFATHGSLGVVDLGATKTVIGSNHVKELLGNLSPNIKKLIYRCPCKITFRFGNHGVLQSDVALVIPIHGFHLKVAIVPGSTPFLLSNTLLRALESIIDTQEKVLISKKLNMSFPLQLTSKGLFLLDLNDLASVESGRTATDNIAETNVVVEPKGSIPSCSTAVQECQSDIQLGKEVGNQKSHQQNQNQTEETLSTTENPSSPVQEKIQFARSFQVPDRESQHVVGQPSSETPGASRRTCSGSQQDVNGPVGERKDHVWNSPQGPHISRSLGHRSEMDPMVQSTLRKFKERIPSSVLGLRGAHGRASRTHPGVDPGHRAQQDATTAEPHQQFRGSWETIPKECSKVQGSAQCV